MLAREVCEQELELNLGPDQELITVLNEMAEAVQYQRLYGWMAQYRAGLALGAEEIAREAEAHLYPVSAEISASLKQREPRELRENRQPAEQGHRQGGSPLQDRSSAKAHDAAQEECRRPRSRTQAEAEAILPATARRRKTPKGGE
jgi:hypothetical protein